MDTDYLKERLGNLHHSQPSWLTQALNNFPTKPNSESINLLPASEIRTQAKNLLQTKFSLKDFLVILSIAAVGSLVVIGIFRASFMTGLLVFAALLFGFLISKSAPENSKKT